MDNVMWVSRERVSSLQKSSWIADLNGTHAIITRKEYERLKWNDERWRIVPEKQEMNDASKKT